MSTYAVPLRRPGAVLADWYRKVTGRCAKRRPVGTAVVMG